MTLYRENLCGKFAWFDDEEIGGGVKAQGLDRMPGLKPDFISELVDFAIELTRPVMIRDADL